jgi:hypothetical protein
VVTPPSPEIPHRSRAWLTGAHYSAGPAPPLHLSPSFLAHEHRTASLMLPNTSIHRAVAGDASPTMTRSAMHGGGHLFELYWSCHGHCWVRTRVGVRRWSWPSRRPHRRRVLAVGDLLSLSLCVCLTSGVEGPLSAAGVCVWVPTRVALAISAADFEKDFRNDFLENS